MIYHRLLAILLCLFVSHGAQAAGDTGELRKDIEQLYNRVSRVNEREVLSPDLSGLVIKRLFTCFQMYVETQDLFYLNHFGLLMHRMGAEPMRWHGGFQALLVELIETGADGERLKDKASKYYEALFYAVLISVRDLRVHSPAIVDALNRVAPKIKMAFLKDLASSILKQLNRENNNFYALRTRVMDSTNTPETVVRLLEMMREEFALYDVYAYLLAEVFVSRKEEPVIGYAEDVLRRQFRFRASGSHMSLLRRLARNQNDPAKQKRAENLIQYLTQEDACGENVF